MEGIIDLDTFTKNDVTNQTCLAITEENKNVIDRFNHENSRIRIDSTMRDLERIGRLINLADVGSQGYRVNIQIQMMMSKHQNLVKESMRALQNSQDSTLNALQKHVEAAENFKDGEYRDALENISEIKPLAEKMEALAKKLENSASILENEAEQSFYEALQQDVKNAEDEKKLEAENKRRIEEKAQRESKNETLEKDLEILREETKKALKAADDERSRKLLMSVLENVVMPVATVYLAGGSAGRTAVAIATGATGALNKLSPGESGKQEDHKKDEDQAEEKTKKVDKSTVNETEDRLERTENRLWEMREEDRKNKAEIAKILKELEHGDNQIRSIKSAIEMMKITVLSLRRTKTAFSNLRMFWSEQVSRCENLSLVNIKTHKYLEKYVKEEKGLIGRIEKNIVKSGQQWFANLRLLNLSIEQIKPVVASIDHIMDNPPWHRLKDEELLAYVLMQSRNIVND